MSKKYFNVACVIFYACVVLSLKIIIMDFPLRHIIFPLISCLTLIFAGRLFSDKKAFLSSFIMLYMFMISVVWIPGLEQTTSNYNSREYFHYVSFCLLF